MSYRRLWIALVLVLAVSFAVLAGVGVQVVNSAPPIPDQVVSTNGRLLFDGDAIRDGQGGLAIDRWAGSGLGVGPRRPQFCLLDHQWRTGAYGAA